MNKMKAKKNLMFFVTLLVLILFMVPFFILVINTFKTTQEFIQTPFALPKSLNFENFFVAVRRMNFWTALKNTAVVTVAAVLVNTIGMYINNLFKCIEK